MNKVELNLFIVPTSPGGSSPSTSDFQPLANKGIQHIFAPSSGDGQYHEAALNMMRLVGAAIKNIDPFVARKPMGEGLGQFRRRVRRGIQEVVDPVVADVMDSRLRAEKSGEKRGDGIRGVGLVLPIPMARDFMDIALNGASRNGKTHSVSLEEGYVYNVRMQGDKASYLGSFPLQPNSPTGLTR